MIVLGVTGSIGMGKSTVSAMLREMGVPVHDSDAAVHQLIGAGGAGVSLVAEHFPDVLRRDDTGVPYIDRPALGKIVFADEGRRKFLEDLLHPLIRAEAEAFLAQERAKGTRMAALDIPLLFETGGEARVDKIICVTAAPEVQRARVLARHNMTPEKFERVLASQMPDAEKRQRAHYVLLTDKSLADTKTHLRRIVDSLLPPAPKETFKKTMALLACLLGLAAAAPAQADDALERPVVLEMFTSQACGACPNGEAFLHELGQQPGVLALEYHVNYWDNQVTFGGKWVDPYSVPQWTQRQLAYGRLMGRGDQLMTPQIVVNGRYQSLAGKREEVLRLIGRAREDLRDEIEITQSLADDGVLDITLRGRPMGKTLDVVVTRHILEVSTDVKAGENKGERLTNRNVVRGLTAIGTWPGGKVDFRYPVNKLGRDESCAILVQDRVNMRIVAARQCLLPG